MLQLRVAWTGLLAGCYLSHAPPADVAVTDGIVDGSADSPICDPSSEAAPPPFGRRRLLWRSSLGEYGPTTAEVVFDPAGNRIALTAGPAVEGRLVVFEDECPLGTPARGSAVPVWSSDGRTLLVLARVSSIRTLLAYTVGAGLAASYSFVVPRDPPSILPLPLAVDANGSTILTYGFDALSTVRSYDAVGRELHRWTEGPSDGSWDYFSAIPGGGRVAIGMPSDFPRTDGYLSRIELLDRLDDGSFRLGTVIGENELGGGMRIGVTPSWTPDGRTLAFLGTARPPAAPSAELFVFSFDDDLRWTVARSGPVLSPYRNSDWEPVDLRADGRQVLVNTCTTNRIEDCALHLFEVRGDAIEEIWTERPTLDGVLLCPTAADIAPDGRIAVLAPTGCSDRTPGSSPATYLFVYEP